MNAPLQALQGFQKLVFLARTLHVRSEHTSKPTQPTCLVARRTSLPSRHSSQLLGYFYSYVLRLKTVCILFLLPVGCRLVDGVSFLSCRIYRQMTLVCSWQPAFLNCMNSEQRSRLPVSLHGLFFTLNLKQCFISSFAPVGVQKPASPKPSGREFNSALAACHQSIDKLSSSINSMGVKPND